MSLGEYSRTTWTNTPSTPLNASNLNKIEDELEALDTVVPGLQETVQEIKEVELPKISQNTTKIGQVEDTLTTTNRTVAQQQTDLTSLTTRVTTIETNYPNTYATKNEVSTVDGKVTVVTNQVEQITTNYPKTYETIANVKAGDSTLNSKIDGVDGKVTTVSATVSTLDQRVTVLEQQGTGGGGGASTWDDITNKPNAFNPIAHANANSATYGAATSSLYGHVKLDSGDMAQTTATNGIAAGRGHTHSNLATKDVATTESDGLLSAEDKAKLDAVEAGANKYVLPDIVNKSKVETSGTTVAFSIDGKEFSQVVAVDGGSLSVGSADKLTSARTISLTGDVTGSTTFDGSANASITTTVADDSHNHSASTITSGTLDIARIPTGTTSSTVALGNHSHSSYVNQNAFSNITVGSTTLAADSTTDTVTLVAGNNVTLTPDATNDKITIEAKDSTYTAGTGIAVSTSNVISNSGVRSITQDSTDKHKLIINTNGTTATITTVDTTYSFSANTPTLEWEKTATIGTAGGTTYKVTMPSNPNTDTKVTAVGNHYSPSADSSAALDVDASGGSSATWNSTQFVTGVNLQRDAKGHVTGITVDSAKMPANPDTDTHHQAKNIVGATSAASANATATNGNVYLNLIENGAVRSTHKIVGSGATTVTADANGNITISSTDTDTDTTYDIATSSTAGLVKSGGDVTVGTDGKMTVVDDSHNHVISNIDGLADILKWNSYS